MKYLSILFFLIQAVHAQEVSVSECLESLPELSIGKSRADIISPCLTKIENESAPLAKTQSIDGEFKFYGHKGLLLFYKEDKFQYYYGQNTFLKEIKAISFDEVKKEVIVLDQESLLTFPLKHSGNIGPSKILENKILKDAIDVKIDSVSGQIIVLNSKAKQIQFFSREASVYALKEHKKFEPLRFINLENFKAIKMKIEQKDHILRVYGNNEECLESNLKESKLSLRQIDCPRLQE